MCLHEGLPGEYSSILIIHFRLPRNPQDTSLLKFAFFFLPLPASFPQESLGHPSMPPHLLFSLAWAICLVAEIDAERCSVPITWLPTEHTFLSKLLASMNFRSLYSDFFPLMFFCHRFSSEHLSSVCGGGGRSVLSGLHITATDFVVSPKKRHAWRPWGDVRGLGKTGSAFGDNIDQHNNIIIIIYNMSLENPGDSYSRLPSTSLNLYISLSQI